MYVLGRAVISKQTFLGVMKSVDVHFGYFGVPQKKLGSLIPVPVRISSEASTGVALASPFLVYIGHKLGSAQ